MKRKTISVLGSTGSIGTSTLDVVRALEPSLGVAALSCNSNAALLKRQIREFAPGAVAVADPAAGEALGEIEGIRSYRGSGGLLEMIRDIECDVVVNGISGSPGLLPSLEALRRGMDLALANKETIVMAGKLVRDLCRQHGSRLLPVDSEHHALFCLLQGRDPQSVEEIILTASGGAFRELPYEQLQDVGVEDAVRHPNWQMGAKITVDSATMANKGLEVIEAHHLFAIPLEKIKVLIHPQSCVHALLRGSDGFLYAQVSQPDMRLPIQNALTYPETAQPCTGGFDLTERELSFQAVDPRKYRMLALAYQAAEQGGSYPVAYNAANEVAVARFLDRQIGFLDIAALVERALQRDWTQPSAEVEQILEMDRRVREAVLQTIGKRKG